jgi:very-short-patch-repair endonuclease
VSVITAARKTLLKREGLPTGTALEDRVTWLLHKWKAPAPEHQYPVGRYRIDFAWPAKRLALEVDGPHHWRPDIAVRDVARDAYLRAHGWLVLRIDDTDDTLEDQLLRAVDVVRSVRDHKPDVDGPIGAAVKTVWDRQVLRSSGDGE